MSELLAALPAWPVLAVASVIVLAASAMQAVLGMGFGLAASPLLLLLEPAFVPSAAILIGMTSSGLGASREWSRIQWGDVGFATVGRVAGVLVALWLLSRLSDTGQFKLVFGLLVGLAVVLSTMGWSLPYRRMPLVAMAWISGCMGTITGVGAPPLAYIYQQVDPAIARPTLAAFFCLGCAASALGLAVIGWLGGLELMLALFIVPAMIAGTLLGRRFTISSTALYRKALLCFAAAASFILVIQGIHGLLK